MTDAAYCLNDACRWGRDKSRKVVLKTIEANYSGTGVDIMMCPVCKREYEVSYRVDTITRIHPDTGEPMP